MEHRGMLVAGMGAVLAMSALFLLNAADRGPVYFALQTVAVGAGALALMGALRSAPALLAGGFGGMAVARLLHVALDQSRLPLWLQLGLALGFLLAAGHALSWSLRPGRAMEAAQGIRVAAWGLMALHFAAAVLALGRGSFSGASALALGCIGFSLVAPNFGAPPAQAPARVVVGGGRE